MSEDDFAKVVAPKITGTRVLHDAFKDHDLEFFVMFGSAGSTIASPGQGNYAAANAFLDAFAHFRQAQGLPALTIGWGPWSVGMVEELKLEKIYAQRGIELITPAVGARILDRLINQKTPNVVAITADWSRARHAGLGGRLPMMFSDLETDQASLHQADSESSILDVLAATPERGQAGGDRRSSATDRGRGLRLRRHRHRVRRHPRRHRPGFHDGDGLQGQDQHDVLDRYSGAGDSAGASA